MTADMIQDLLTRPVPCVQDSCECIIFHTTGYSIQP